MHKCILCLEIKKLSHSHILPRTFFNRIKNGTPQLLKMNSDINVPPVLDNANWNEPLMCADCEHFINITYEKPQIAYLRSYKSTYKSHNKTTFRNFNFERFYLFWLSIIWRASESSLAPFKDVNLGPEVNDLIRQMIIFQKTSMAGVEISDFIKIGMIRITPEKGLDDKVVRSILTQPILEHTSSGFSFYFMVEGYLVLYIFSTAHYPSVPRHFGEIKKSMFLRVPRVPIHKSEHARKLFLQLSSIATAHPNWRA